MPALRTLILSFSAGLLCAAAASHAAEPVYKCRADGKVSYSDRPCPGGKGETLPPPALQSGAGIPVGDTVDTGDARALLDLEKERTELTRQRLALAREQAKQQAKQQAAAAREARTGRVEVKQVQHCDKLRLKQKWLKEDMAKAHSPAQHDALATRLRRQAETMAVECPA